MANAGIKLPQYCHVVVGDGAHVHEVRIRPQCAKIAIACHRRLAPLTQCRLDLPAGGREMSVDTDLECIGARFDVTDELI